MFDDLDKYAKNLIVSLIFYFLFFFHLVPSYSVTQPSPIERDPDKNEHSIQIDVGNKKLKIHLQNNGNIYPLSHIVEHHIDNDDIQTYTGLPGRYSFGSVEGDDESVVALDHSNGGYVSYLHRRCYEYVIL